MPLPDPMRIETADHIVRIIAPAMIIIQTISLGFVIFLSGQQYHRMIPALLALLPMIPAWYLAVKNRPYAGVMIIVFTLNFAVLAAMFFSGGIYAPAFMATIAIVTVFVVMYGTKGGLIYSAAVIIIGGIFIWLDAAGISQEKAPPPSAFQLFTIGLYMLGQVVFISIPVKLMMKAFTDVQEASEKRLKAIAELDDILKRTPDIIFRTDGNGKVTFINNAVVKYGYIPDMAIGMDIQKMVHPDDRIHMKNVLNELNLGFKKEQQLIVRFITRTDEELEKVSENRPFHTFLMTMSGISDSAKETDPNGIEFQGIARDITEKERTEQQLRQLQKIEAIGTLAGGIAHDFNNILGALMGYAELVKDELPQESQLRQRQEQVIKASLRAKKLVEQILLFSRQTEKEVKPIKPHLILNEALKLLRSSIPSTIEIKQNIPNDLGYIVADPTHVHQIIMNLCTNAYHAMREKGGILAVTLSKMDLQKEDISFAKFDLDPGTYLMLEVSDTGHGMDPSTIEKIFNPYFTTKPKGEGTGLGLSIVHGIVKSYGGAINVYSEPGHGTSIRIYFPKIEKNSAPEKDTNNELLKGNERILVVDDDPSLLEMMELSLQSLGYKVSSFLNSQKAFDTFQAMPDHFDLIITDMTMPNMTGLELSKQIFDIKPQMPIILCTGFSELMSEEKANALGIKGFLLKPVLRRNLSDMIRKILDNHQTAI